MSAKKCNKCRRPKPLSDFYKHPRSKDGRAGKCMECAKSDSRLKYRANRESRREYERRRFKNPRRKSMVVKYQREMRMRNQEKYRARNAVSNALRDGRLIRGECECCGSPQVEAHHDDYSKPLDVRWLCRRHHLEVHGKASLSDQRQQEQTAAV